MSDDKQTDEPLSERTSPLEAPDTRIDAAHVRADEPLAGPQRAEPVHAKAAAAESAASLTAQHVGLQASQLASHLQRQQSSVDHRESELNARVAAMENQIRAARLWLEERHAELATRKAELDRREVELADDTGRPKRSPGHEQTPITSGERPHSADSLDAYRARLERSEVLLSNQTAEVERQRNELSAERAAFAETMRTERQKMADEASRFSAQRNRTRQALERQADELSTRSAALERLRADVKQAQTNALELRLATEEVWNRLCGSMAPAAVTQSLAQTRLQLAEEQRMARSELVAEREEVQRLARQVAQQHEKLAGEREELRAWVQARQEELERQAGILSAREREMGDLRAAFEEKAGAWRSERTKLEQEIRRLLRNSDREASAAAA